MCAEDSIKKINNVSHLSHPGLTLTGLPGLCKSAAANCSAPTKRGEPEEEESDDG